MKIVILGLSLSSSWGNGHATTWRALIPGLARAGCDVLFLERDVPWYAAHRDFTTHDACELAFYSRLGDLSAYASRIAAADAVVVSSFVPEGTCVGDFVLQQAKGVRAFYDIDTPVTLQAVDQGDCAYIRRDQFGSYDGYLSFTGGPMLRKLDRDYGARLPRALYCSVDAALYRPVPVATRWELGYMGTFSEDRQEALDALLLEPARRAPDKRFVVVGAQYPESGVWPDNVDHIEHLAPDKHPEFYASLRWTLNLTRTAMKKAGFSPSVRLFEAGACGTPIISDDWPGLETALCPGREIVVAGGAEDVLAALEMPESERQSIALAARTRTLERHSGDRRTAELIAHLAEFARAKQSGDRRALAARRTPEELTS